MIGGVTCPNCGKDNPDFLDNCQFCQAVLRTESTLNIGEHPTKKVTAELEEILPDWLRDARQQSRDAAEEESKKEETKPKVQKEEPIDLLAGLAFQASSDDEEVPDWLASLNPVEKKSTSSKPADDEPIDFFAQFNQPAQESAMPTSGGITQSEAPGSTDDTQKDDLTGWLPEQSGESLNFDSREVQDEHAWMNNLGAPVSSEPEKPAEPEDLSWLHELESSTKQQPAAPQADMGWLPNLDSVPAQPSDSQDDLSWLNNLGGMPAPSIDMPTPVQPTAPQEDLSWLNNLGGISAPASNEPAPAQPAASQEDLSWLDNLGGTSAPASNEPARAQPAASQEDLSWLNNLGGTLPPSFDASTPAQPAASQEDLSWLNNLGGTPAPASNEPASVQPTASQEDLSWLNDLGGTPAPSFDAPAPAQPVVSQEDLNWLDNLGGTPPAPSSNVPAPAQPAAPQDDLDWLSNLGGTPTPSFDAPTPAQPVASQEDLSWLDNLGGTPTPSFNEPAPVQPVASQDDLDWLSNLGATPTPSFNEPAPAQPASSQDDLDWLNNLGGTPAADAPAPFAQTDQLKGFDNPPDATASPFAPGSGYTGPLRDEVAQTPMPDWLKDATEKPDMPPLGATSMDWFASKEDVSPPPALAQNQETPAPVEQNFFATPGEPSSLSNQDVDSLFAVDMPDWLSQPESAAGADSAQANIPSEANDSLAPVNLPSWVQAMRPVEAAISNDVSAVSPEQNTEREGPLAGFHGLIPLAPIGSAQRPKAISLKLQATDEQQTTAALLEQIVASETTAHPLKTTPFVASQRILRRALTALFLIVLGAMVALGSQTMPVVISNAQLADIGNMATTIQGISENAPVLVVMDYEPALAGEMEAAAGPLLDQIVVARKPNLTFISTSPTGSALAERLMTRTKINQSTPDGLGYQLGTQYFNLGYLAGGSAGVRGFIEQPQAIMPSAKVNLFSDFAAVIVITDHAESGLVWIEQMELMKQSNPAFANQPLLVVASAQAGPLLQPYVSSKQVNGMVSGLSDASRYEYMNGSRPGIARSYWDAFGVGLFMAIVAIILGSLWSLFMGIRSRRAEAGQG